MKNYFSKQKKQKVASSLVKKQFGFSLHKKDIENIFNAQFDKKNINFYHKIPFTHTLRGAQKIKLKTHNRAIGKTNKP